MFPFAINMLGLKYVELLFCLFYMGVKLGLQIFKRRTQAEGLGERT
jgi:hypothetical protein